MSGEERGTPFLAELPGRAGRGWSGKREEMKVTPVGGAGWVSHELKIQPVAPSWAFVPPSLPLGLTSVGFGRAL